MKMTVDQMARELSADLGNELDHRVSNKAAKAVLTKVFEYIGQSLADGHEVNIPGFGKFRVNDKPEREVRNPKTGEMMTVPAKRALKFTPSKNLKDSVGG